MASIRVADIDRLADGQNMKALANGRELLLARIGGRYYAIDNKCPHMGGSLSDGVLEGNVITCPRHGAQFDVKTGQAVESAKLGFIKMGVKDVASYPVKVEGPDILVGID